jgi:hypothetical protein
VSANQRYLVTESGQPFFWLADTAWEIIHRLTREEIDHYLDNRQRLGFSVIQAVVVPESDGLRSPNAYGEAPFFDLDPLQPNEAYFAHVDYLVRAAATRGLYVALLPMWGDKMTLLWGIGPVIFTLDNLDVARRYGAWIGARYRDASSVVWILGGDRPALKDQDDWRPIWRALAEGIRAGAGDDVLMSYHPWGHPEGTLALHDEAWLDFHMLQSGHVWRDMPNWDAITRLLALTPPKPVLDSEPNYEDHAIDPFLRTWQPSYGCYNEYDVRKQAWRAVFAGACGHTYGHHSIWQFYSPERAPINFPQCTWQQALERPGAAQLIHLRRLLEARAYLTRIPDQSLLRTPEGARATHMRATRDSEGSYALVYVPQAGARVALDLAWLGGGAGQAWWLDPRSGVCIDLGSVQGSLADFTTPDYGPDWVLVVDAARAGYPAPGPLGVLSAFGDYR